MMSPSEPAAVCVKVQAWDWHDAVMLYKRNGIDPYDLLAEALHRGMSFLVDTWEAEFVRRPDLYPPDWVPQHDERSFLLPTLDSGTTPSAVRAKRIRRLPAEKPREEAE